MCHLNLGNLMDVQERHTTNRKYRNSGAHGQFGISNLCLKSFLVNLDRRRPLLPTLNIQNILSLQKQRKAIFCAQERIGPGSPSLWSKATESFDFCEVRAKKPSLTLNLGTNGLKVTSKPPPMGQAGRLQGQDRSAVTCPSSGHARRCLIWLSCDNRRTRYTAPLAKINIYESRRFHCAGCKSQAQCTSKKIKITTVQGTVGYQQEFRCRLFHQHRVVSSETMKQEGDGQEGKQVKTSRFRPYDLVLHLSVMVYV
ncbi:hypothetical protein J6590_057076 [Homalodisca vitripennis]|nr:hypothetical protein J6590_057076 [Homalodisca vitripennis]